MKKTTLTLLFLFGCLMGFSQAKKPTLMLVPSDVWCNDADNNYVKEFDNQGYIEKVPDYDKALFENQELTLVISKIGEMMAEREFPLEDLAQTLKAIKQQEIENSVNESKSGDIIAETPLEMLNNVAKADIIMQLTWKINKKGPMRSLTFNLQGFDAYTNKQIAAASGTGRSSSNTEVAIMLEDAVLSYIDQFNLQLQNHFDDLFTNGREISLQCKRWSGAEIDFDSYVNDEELGVLIEDWVADNTVEGRFSTSDYTQNKLTFKQVRIPLYNENGRALDTRRWASGLRKYLKSLNINSQITTKGLGQAIITIGE